MITYTIRPLDDLTIFRTPADDRDRAPWSVTWTKVMKDLGRELDHLGASEVVFEVATTSDKIRRDGMLRADAKVGHPGVRASFDSAYGPLSYTSDRYVAGRTGMAGWQANVRAISLTLTALRAVDRYGTTRGEQYAGFKQLGARTRATQMGGMTREQAVYVIDEYQPSDWSSRDRESARLAYRQARAAAHPDRHGGDRTAWDAVEEAARVLGIDR